MSLLDDLDAAIERALTGGERFSLCRNRMVRLVAEWVFVAATMAAALFVGWRLGA